MKSKFIVLKNDPNSHKERILSRFSAQNPFETTQISEEKTFWVEIHPEREIKRLKLVGN